MHYTGMAAMRGHVELSYDPLFVVLSLLIAIGASTVALWLAFRTTDRGSGAEHELRPGMVKKIVSNAFAKNGPALRLLTMSNRRIRFHGLFAVLLALMAQLGIGASVPRLDAFAQIIGTEILCHPPDKSGSTPAQAPLHPLDCLICPLCAALHAPPMVLVSDVAVHAPHAVVLVLRSELPPPSIAPPSSRRAPSQPRAPPTYS
jgi:hypothetical protein